MRELQFKSCRFIKSSAGEDFPKANFPHFVLMGRSNVGKSSLINYLFRNNSLAKISSTPGKTALINFFLIDEKAFLVDLPGYGYAKRGKDELKKWPLMMEKYFQAFPDAILLQLLDSRREPSFDDGVMLDWARETGKNPLIVFTKTDKIPKTMRKSALKKLADSLGSDVDYVATSINEGASREELIKAMSEKWAALEKIPTFA